LPQYGSGFSQMLQDQPGMDQVDLAGGLSLVL
jgi:hypothetical protein